MKKGKKEGRKRSARETGGILKKILAFFVPVLILFASPAQAYAQTGAAEDHTELSETMNGLSRRYYGDALVYHDYDGLTRRNSTGIFVVDTEGEQYFGYCCDPVRQAPHGEKTVYEVNDTRVKEILLCMYGGPLYDLFDWDSIGLSQYVGGEWNEVPQEKTESKIAISTAVGHSMLGLVLSGDTTCWTSASVEKLKAGIAAIHAFVSGNSAYGKYMNYRVRALDGAVNEDSGAAAQDVAWIEGGEITLKKSSGRKEFTDGNACYSLQGAVYGLYSDKACTAEVDRFQTGKDGTGTSAAAPGIYYLKEIQAPQGYMTDDRVYPVTVKNKETAVIEVKETPMEVIPEILIAKKDKETGESSPVEGAVLSGAEFTVSFYGNADASGEPVRKWVFHTDEEGNVFYDDEHLESGRSDMLYCSAGGKTVLPLGSLKIEEMNAPEGYLKNEEIQVLKIVTEGRMTAEVPEQVIRGDIAFNKISADRQDRMAGTVFKITAADTGESHTVMTDENGYWSSESVFRAHTEDTNGGGEKSGVWFGTNGLGTVCDPDDSLGAFPYGTYLFEEQSSEANAGYRLISFSVTVSRHGYTVDAGTKSDEPEEVVRKEKPASYTLQKKRVTEASSNGRGKFGFLRGDTVTYEAVVTNTGEKTLTMDVTDSFEKKEYFTDLKITRIRGGKVNSSGGASANITLEPGEKAVITYTAAVSEKAKELLADHAADDGKGYVNTVRTTNVRTPDGSALEDREAEAHTPVREAVKAAGAVVRRAGSPKTGDRQRLFLLMLTAAVSLITVFFSAVMQYNRRSRRNRY